jgi:hypothetical protein
MCGARRAADETAQFEAAFAQAQAIISASPGYLSHELQKGFHQSAPYQQCKKLLHHFYDPFPTVEHYEAVAGSNRSHG